MQVVDIVQPEKSVLRVAFAVEQREHDARQFRTFTIDQAVSGEMYDAVIRELRTKNDLAIRVEADGFESGVPRRHRDDAIRLGAGREESRNLYAVGRDAGVTRCQVHVVRALRSPAFNIQSDARIVDLENRIRQHRY